MTTNAMLLNKALPEPPTAHSHLSRWSLVVAVNDNHVLRNTLLASPAIDSGCRVIIKRGYACAGLAYNAGLDEAQGDIVVFAHQDVYLPATWLSSLRSALQQLSLIDQQWSVLGSFGVTRQTPAELHGYCYSTGLRRVLGGPFASPVPAQSLDELVLVVRRSSGLRFDERLPGFHLYGTDICLQAQLRGLGSYIIPAFCIHNANGVIRIPADFWRAWLYLRRKWWRRLPVTTCCTSITKGVMPVVQRIALEARQLIKPVCAGTRCRNLESLHDLIKHLESQIAPMTLP